MKIEQLIVTHNHLRHKENLHEMVRYVAEGGLWTPDFLKKFSQEKGLDRVSPLIQLSLFEDGAVYLHDGHHRVVSTFLAGRKELNPSEYHIANWTYPEYLEISHPNGWYTPFDPRLHTRTPDFGKFKKQAKEKFLIDPIDAEKWVLDNQHLYREPRKYRFIPEFAQEVLWQIQKGVDPVTGKMWLTDRMERAAHEIDAEIVS